MLVNIPFDLGYGLTTYLQSLGYSLTQRGNDWYLEGATTEAEAQALINSYNPWPVEKANKLAEINESFVQQTDFLTQGATEAEQKSWSIQKAEAENYPDKPCKSLQILADVRGIPIDIMVAKVLEKSEMYNTAYFTLQALRDKAEDKIKAMPNSGSYEKLPELWAIKFGD